MIARLRPRTTPTIATALEDPNLLGAALGDLESWQTWSITLKAAFGLPLSDSERAVFNAIAGERGLPLKRVKELWCICGRGSGKSRMAAAIAVYIACFVPHSLAPGETGYVLVLSASKDQSSIVFDYSLGFLEQSPVLRHEIASTTASEIRLKNGIIIGIHANSWRNIRGRSLLAAVADEIAMWRDESSAIPDIETYRAVRPSLTRTHGLLVGISTPYRKVGLLHQKHRDHYGQDGDVLVVQGKSLTFNPTLSETDIQSEIAADPEGARAEWMAEFRSDLSSFLDDATIEVAIDHARPLELAPRAGKYYRAFTDPSGGRHDAFTLCIGHLEGEQFIADCIRSARPPFDPFEVTKDYARLCRDYRVFEIVGDKYAAEWVAQSFRDAGMRYRQEVRSKSDLYLEALPLFTRGLIALPDHAALIRELRLFERATHKGGRDSVDHPRNGSDDLANALTGCAVIACKPGYDPTGAWIDTTPRSHRPRPRPTLRRGVSAWSSCYCAARSCLFEGERRWSTKTMRCGRSSGAAAWHVTARSSIST
jgi:hypothetical protein